MWKCHSRSLGWLSSVRQFVQHGGSGEGDYGNRAGHRPLAGSKCKALRGHLETGDCSPLFELGICMAQRGMVADAISVYTESLDVSGEVNDDVAIRYRTQTLGNRDRTSPGETDI